MNNEYLSRAHHVMPDSKKLIVVASRRARQLAQGAHPMIRCKDDNFIDVALLEIAEGLLDGKEGLQDDFLKELAALKEQAAAQRRKAEAASEVDLQN